MPLDLDVRDFLLWVSYLLSGLTVTARSPDFETLRDVTQALNDPEAQPIVAPGASAKERFSTCVGRKKWLSNGTSWH